MDPAGRGGIVDVAGAQEDPQRHRLGRQPNEDAGHAQSDLPAVHWKLPAGPGLIALGKAERQAGHELHRPGHGATDHSEPQQRVGGPVGHSEGESCVRTTSTASALTTYQYSATPRTPISQELVRPPTAM